MKNALKTTTSVITILHLLTSETQSCTCCKGIIPRMDAYVNGVKYVRQLRSVDNRKVEQRSEKMCVLRRRGIAQRLSLWHFSALLL